MSTELRDDFKMLSYRLRCLSEYLDQRNATDEEFLCMAADLTGRNDYKHWEDEYFWCCEPLGPVDYLTALRAERLRPHLKTTAAMTHSDILKICLYLQKYSEVHEASQYEYRKFMEWLETGVIEGSCGNYWFRDFFRELRYPKQYADDYVELEINDVELAKILG